MRSVVDGVRNVCMAAVVAAFAGCSGGGAVNSLEKMGLRGDVKSLEVSAYEAEACGDTVTKGARVDDMQSCCLYRFDERGYVAGTEYLCGGHAVQWEEFVYDGSGRPERIVSRSVRYGGDRTVEFEWNGRCHVRRTFDEEGNEVSEERTERRRNRSESVAVGGGDSVTFRTRYRRGLPVRQERTASDGTEVLKYSYDRNGNPVRSDRFVDGVAAGSVEMTYTVFDGEGNWTSRTVYRTTEDGERVPYRIEERKITYY